MTVGDDPAVANILYAMGKDAYESYKFISFAVENWDELNQFVSALKTDPEFRQLIIDQGQEAIFNQLTAEMDKLNDGYNAGTLEGSLIHGEQAGKLTAAIAGIALMARSAPQAVRNAGKNTQNIFNFITGKGKPPLYKPDVGNGNSNHNKPLDFEYLESQYGKGNVEQGGGNSLTVKENVNTSQQGSASSNFEQHRINELIANAERISTAKPGVESTVPRNLYEQLAWSDVINNPTSGRVLSNMNNDPRFPLSAGFQKMEAVHAMPDGSRITIHYQYNAFTNKAYDVKLKNPAPKWPQPGISITNNQNGDLLKK